MARPNFKLSVPAAEKALLEARFKATDEVRQRQRLQALLLATTGEHGYREIARIVGCSTSTFALWLNQCLAGGVAELLRRDSPPGQRSPVGTPEVQAGLRAGLTAGRWRTAAQVAAWLQEAHGLRRAAKSLYYWLGKVGGALRVPRPCHVQQDPAAPAACRAGLVEKLEALGLPKDRPVRIWVADEARFGRHTQSRRGGALRGRRVVISPAAALRMGACLRGAGSPRGAAPSSASCPRSAWPSAGTSSASWRTADPAAEPVVIQDQAGFHPRETDPHLPARIHPPPLPPYSPELNPTEGLWDQVQDVTCNRRHDSLDALEETLTAAPRPFWETPSRVSSLIHHWLLVQANATPKAIVPIYCENWYDGAVSHG